MELELPDARHERERFTDANAAVVVSLALADLDERRLLTMPRGGARRCGRDRDETAA